MPVERGHVETLFKRQEAVGGPGLLGAMEKWVINGLVTKMALGRHSGKDPTPPPTPCHGLCLSLVCRKVLVSQASCESQNGGLRVKD